MLQSRARDDGWIFRSPDISVSVELFFNCADCFSIYRLRVLESQSYQSSPYLILISNSCCLQFERLQETDLNSSFLATSRFEFKFVALVKSTYLEMCNSDLKVLFIVRKLIKLSTTVVKCYFSKFVTQLRQNRVLSCNILKLRDIYFK